MAKRSKLKVIPLGGLQEVGKNLTVFEYDQDIMIVDCGIAFPEDEMLGIDLVIPDVTYLEKNVDKIRGIVLTHGHEDHIGAVPYVLRLLGNIPVYGTKLTLALLENKAKEHNMKIDTRCVKAKEKVALGVFKVEFVHTTHSIADAVALAIHTPVGAIVHSGDFKIDFTPIDGEVMDFARFGELGKKGVLLFLCDSTNAERKGYTMSEKSVGAVFDEIFQTSQDSRIMVASFSSNIHRIQQVVNSAYRYNRKIAVIGRSMINNVQTASELGYLTLPKNMVIDISEIKNYSDNQLVIITTGSQGEPMSALSRIASSEHKYVSARPGDKIVISASSIPGNEKSISKVINELLKKGADVIYEGLAEIHVSGHAKAEELKLVHSLLKPKFFMPVHGEYMHLNAHKNIAKELGMNPKNIFLMSNGDVLEVNHNSAKVTGTVPTGQVMVDGLGVGDVGNIVLRDRKHLSQDGLMVVVVTMSRESGLVEAGPDIISRGFVYVRESEDLMDEARMVVKEALLECEKNNIKGWSYMKGLIKKTLKDFLWEKTQRSPMILPIIMEV